MSEEKEVMFFALFEGEGTIKYSKREIVKTKTLKDFNNWLSESAKDLIESHGSALLLIDCKIISL